jgi:hypothetical protein
MTIKPRIRLRLCTVCWSGDIIELHRGSYVTYLAHNCYCGHEVMSEKMYEAYLHEINLVVDDRYYLHQP